MAGDRDATHTALTNLYNPGGALATPPSGLNTFFDTGRIADLARTYLQSQPGVHAVAVPS